MLRRHLVMDGNMKEFRDGCQHFRKSYLLLIIHIVSVIGVLCKHYIWLHLLKESQESEWIGAVAGGGE